MGSSSFWRSVPLGSRIVYEIGQVIYHAGIDVAGHTIQVLQILLSNIQSHGNSQQRIIVFDRILDIRIILWFFLLGEYFIIEWMIGGNFGFGDGFIGGCFVVLRDVFGQVYFEGYAIVF